MPDTTAHLETSQDLAAEVVRLNKVVAALMNRAERNACNQASSFGLFQRGVILEGEVHRRTAALEAALRENERITRDLRESEAKFRGVVSQPLVGIAIIEDGKFTYTNAKLDEIFGYSSDEMRLRGPVDVVVADDQPLVAEQVRRRVSREVEKVHYFSRGRRKDGSVIDVEVFGGALESDGKLLLISLVLDVTDRLRAERELRALQEKFRELSVRDPLTGLFNRRYLEETLARELASAERAGRPISLLMGDLDHFKRVNDHYGHVVGDDVLRSVSGVLTRLTRAGDICCRYGGEEFLIVLPQMDKAVAAQRAEQLRLAVEAMVVHRNGDRISVTASFGVSTYPEDGRGADALIEAADQALYAAKQSGRNRVAVSGPAD